VSQLQSRSLSKRETRILELNKKIDDLQNSKDNGNDEKARYDIESEIVAVQTLLQTEIEEEEEWLTSNMMNIGLKYSPVSLHN